MSRNYDQHIKAYVTRHFRHLMTESERAALDAIVLHVSGNPVPHITFKRGTPENVAIEAKQQIYIMGQQGFSAKIRERLLKEHGTLIFANSCPSCGRLPATPKAKMCIWCSHEWLEG